MMTFLYPIMLGLGILAIVPFIIHLFGERKYHPVAFSSLKFLREIEKESLQKLHLRQWLILLFRALWISMLVLALAVPFVNKAGNHLEPGILVVDRSFSTRTDPRYIDIENEIGKEYERWEFVHYNENSNIDSLHREISEAIQKRGTPKTNVLWLTDLQNNLQNHAVLNMLKTFSDSPYILLKMKTDRNYAIRDLVLLDQNDRDMNGLQVTCSLNRDEDEEETTIYIHVNGKQTGQIRTNVNGTASYFFAKSEEKESRCIAVGGDDNYPEDNRRYLVINNHNRIKVLCVLDPQIGYYHLNALMAMNDIELTKIEPDELPEQDLETYDLIWFSGLYPQTTAGIERLKKYSEDHVLLLTISRTITQQDPWNDLCKGVGLPDQGTGYLGLKDKNGIELHDMKIRRYFRTTYDPENTIWETAAGAPVLFERRKNTFLLMSPFHFDWNEMGLSLYFTRELSRAINMMLARQTRSYICGEALELPESFSTVTTPTGEKHRVRDVFDKTNAPGFYSIENNGIIKTIAVNIPEDECVQSMINDAPNIIDLNAGKIADIHKEIKGRNTQTLFFILAALFIIFEMLLIRRGERTK